MQTSSNLTKISQLKGTFIAFIIILGIAIIVIVISTYGRSQPTTAEAPTIPKRSAIPGTNSVDWSKVTLGLSQKETVKLMGQPIKEDTLEDGRTLMYFPTTPLTPLQRHTVTFENGKSVRIVRQIITDQEQLLKPFFDSNYGEGEKLIDFVSEEKGLMYKYQRGDVIVITEFIGLRADKVDRLYVMTANEYNRFKSVELKISPEEYFHHGQGDFKV